MQKVSPIFAKQPTAQTNTGTQAKQLAPFYKKPMLPVPIASGIGKRKRLRQS